MTRSHNHTETDAGSPDSARGRLRVVLAAALLLLTVLSSLALSTAASADLGDPIIEIPPSNDEVLEVPQLPDTPALEATVTFPCLDDHTGAVTYLEIVNPSPSVELGYSVEVKGPNGSGVGPTAGTMHPGNTSLIGAAGGKNGDFVEAWVRDADGNTVAYEQWTVDCGQPEPWVTFDLVCKNHDAYVVVTLGNDGTAPVRLDVLWAPLQGVGDHESRTVNPGETQTVEYLAEKGETYSVRVFLPGPHETPFAEDTIVVDCYDDPTTPEPKPTPPTTHTPPPTGAGMAPRFTG